MREVEYNQLTSTRDKLKGMLEGKRMPDRYRIDITKQLNEVREQIKKAHHERYHNNSGRAGE